MADASVYAAPQDPSIVADGEALRGDHADINVPQLPNESSPIVVPQALPISQRQSLTGYDLKQAYFEYITNNANKAPSAVDAYDTTLAKVRNDNETFRNEVSARYSQKGTQDIVKLTEDLPASQIAAEADTFHSALQDAANRTTDRLAPEKSWIEGLTDQMGESLQKDEMLSRMGAAKIYDDMIKAVENEGGMAHAATVAGMFIPGRYIMDTLGIDFGAKGEVSYEQFAKMYKSLPPKERLLALSTAAEKINVESDNPEMRLQLFTSLLNTSDPSGDILASRILDASQLPGPSVVKNVVMNVARNAMASTPAKLLNMAGKAEEAAKVVAEAITVPGAAEKNVIPKDAAISSALPFRNDEFFPQQVDGIHNEVATELGLMGDSVRDVRSQIQDALDPSNYVQIIDDTAGEARIVGDAEKEAAVRSLTEELRAKNKDAALPVDIIDYTPMPNGDIRIRVKPEGLTKAEALGSEGIDPNYAEGYDSAGNGPYSAWQGMRNSLNLLEKQASPEYMLTDMLSDRGSSVGKLVETVTAAGMHQDALAANIGRALDKALEPIGGVNPSKKYRESWRKVQAVLEHGDQYNGLKGIGKRFSPDELMHGVTTPDGETHFLSLDERTAYYNYLELGDRLGDFLNEATVKELNVAGKRFVKVGTKEEVIGRPVKSAKGARIQKFDGNKWSYTDEYKLAKNDPDFVIVHLDDPMVDVIAKGAAKKRAAKAAEETGIIEDIGEYTSEYIAIPRHHVRKIEGQVIDRREGYVPLIHDGVRYTIKKHVAGMVNGKVVDFNKEAITASGQGGARTTVAAMHASVSDAEKELAHLNATAGNNTHYTLSSDRDANMTGAYKVSATAGLGIDHRTTEDIIREVGGDFPKRIPAFEAMARYVNKVSTVAPIAEYRAQVMGRFEATMRQIDPEKYANWRFGDGMDRNALPVMARMEDYLKSQLMIPTKEERTLENLSRNIGEYIDRNGIPGFGNTDFSKKVAVSIMNLGYKDPVSAIKSATFHLLLGTWNPAQWLVQAQGGVLAMTVHPKWGLAGAKDAVLMRTAMNVKNPEALDSILNTWKSLGLIKDPKQFKGMIDGFLKSGFYDSIKNSGDLGRIAGGFPTGATAVGKVLDHGLLFYKEGELFSRLTSWGIEHRRVAAGEYGAGLTGDALMREMIGETQKNMLNLTKANQAYWQKGITGIPTQFAQVNAKFYEKLAGRRLTPQAKLALITGQIVMYGGAGYTMKEILWNMYQAGYKLANGKENENPTPRELATVTRGFFGMLAPDLEISARGQLVPPVLDMWYNFILDSGHPVADQMLGASHTIFTRAENVVTALRALTTTPEWTEDKLKVAAIKVASMSSTGSQLEKAMMMHNLDAVISSSGVIQAKGFTASELMGQAMGLAPAKLSNMYATLGDEAHKKAYINNRVGDMLNLYYSHINANGPEAKQEALDTITAMVNLSFSNPNDRRKAMHLLVSRIQKGTSKQETAIRQFIHKGAADGVDQFEQFMLEGTGEEQ